MCGWAGWLGGCPAARADRSVSPGGLGLVSPCGLGPCEACGQRPAGEGAEVQRGAVFREPCVDKEEKKKSSVIGLKTLHNKWAQCRMWWVEGFDVKTGVVL